MTLFPSPFPLPLSPGLPTLYFVAAGLIVALLVVVVLLLWRHKKAGMGEFELVGRIGTVESALEPEGAVIVGGEMWRARAKGGATLMIGERVRVVGASGHLLEVERATT